MKRLPLFLIVAAAAIVAAASATVLRAGAQVPVSTTVATGDPAAQRWQADLAAMQAFRPGYAFWQHIFTIPDGSIAFGSAVDGRLLAVFPARGDWAREGVWTETELADALDGYRFPRDLDARREEVARRLEARIGPVLHNPTRGNFLMPSARRYGRFIEEWSAIYERFGVPADVGLAQIILESGFNGTSRSEADAIGFCQWLRANWRYLNRLSEIEIEAHNQTTQAPYCAAYLSVLATKYGSFVPALSEHNAGGANVGRILITGERLGGEDVRTRYFLGSRLAKDLRAVALDRYRDLYRTYGPRSYLYSEMIAGNTFNVRNLRASIPQVRIHAMRTSRAIPLSEITRRTKLSADEVRRFNPALVRRVPANATLYLPTHIAAFGRDVAFWHRPASAEYAAVLDEFLRLDVPHERWDDPSFEPVLQRFERGFRATGTEEGRVMATILAYVMHEASTSGRREMLVEYRESDGLAQLLERGIRELGVERVAQTTLQAD